MSSHWDLSQQNIFDSQPGQIGDSRENNKKSLEKLKELFANIKVSIESKSNQELEFQNWKLKLDLEF